MVQAIQVLRFHLLELEKVSRDALGVAACWCDNTSCWNYRRFAPSASPLASSLRALPSAGATIRRSVLIDYTQLLRDKAEQNEFFSSTPGTSHTTERTNA